MKRTILIAAVAAAAATAAHAQYPVKPIRMIVPIPAGSLTDVMGRTVAQGVSPSLGQPIIAENRAGAHGTIGMGECARAAPDGYTICMTDGNLLTLNQFAYSKMPYDPKTLTPVVHLSEIEVSMAVKADLPVNNVKEFLDYARARPGQVTWASSGAGSTMHLYLAWFEAKTGLRFNHVPYKGPAELPLVLARGEADITWIAPSSVAPQVKAGKIKVIAVNVGKTRSPFVGDAPSLASQGYDLDFRNWLALVAPPKMPREVVNRWNAEVNKVLHDGKTLGKLWSGTAMIPTGGSPEDLARYIEVKSKVGEELAKIANLKYD